MLRTFAEAGSGFYMSLRDAQLYFQTCFKTMLKRKYIEYVPDQGFRITRLGREAWRDFQRGEIYRKNPMLPLTRIFDAEEYGLDPATYWKADNSQAEKRKRGRKSKRLMHAGPAA